MVAESFRSFVTDRERGLSIRSRIYSILASIRKYEKRKRKEMIIIGGG